VNSKLEIVVRDVPIPTVKPGHVLIRVVVSGTNPKDWKVPQWQPTDDDPQNHGDDIAGYVEAIGEGVFSFKKGDKVAAFHEMMQPHGSWAEYALAWEHTTFHLPETTSFEEAATIPLAAMTSALNLYQHLGLPLPWKPATSSIPLIIYGGATAVGAFAIKLARLSNIHPIITVAGKGISYVETLIDKEKGDVIVDYREGRDAVTAKIREAAGGKPIKYAFDIVSENDTLGTIKEVLDQNEGKLTCVLTDNTPSPGGIRSVRTSVRTVHSSPSNPSDDSEFAAALYQFMARGLAHGSFSGHPFEVVKGGLYGVEKALRDLKEGRASAVKYVLRIADTDGISK